MEELAVTKSAAWAWYQRGSGSDPKPTSEFCLTRTHRVPQPTRYKLEAERSKAKPSNYSNQPSTDSDDSHLLDKYEIECISKHLKNYIEMTNSGELGGRRRVEFSPGSEVIGMIKKEKKEKSKGRSKGFWFIRNGAACGGSTDDVVEFGRGVRDSRRPEKQRRS